MRPLDQNTIAFAHRLADRAGEIIRPYFRQPLSVDDKGAAKGEAFDPVTAADRGAEQALRALIAAERPEDAVLGEEFGVSPGTSGRRWVLDPVDGTRAFLCANHMWGTLIALEDDGQRVLGIIDQPVLRERILAVPGRCERHTAEGITALRTRPCARLADAIVTTTHPWSYFSAQEAAQFAHLAKNARMSRFGGDCYAYGLLAAGFIDLIVEAALRPWDVAALEPVVREAGGLLTDWSGQALSPEGDYFAIVAAGDRRVHAEALARLNAARALP